jgi:hypothetical protein
VYEVFGGIQVLEVLEVHSARFGPPDTKILPRNHFTSKKKGASDGWRINNYAKPNRKQLIILTPFEVLPAGFQA